MGMTGSLESMVICDEVVSYVKRFGRGVDFSPEHLALKVIEEVGPAGNYLTHDHTLRHFRDEFWFPQLMDHNNHDGWVKQGSRSLSDRAHERAEQILQDHSPPALDEKTIGEIYRIAAGKGGH
jgi:trimethylamine--corrinoid protein Co-methyltransferase